MRKLVEQEDLINWWLKKYHKTNLEKVKDSHFEWEMAEKEYDNMIHHRSEYNDEQRKTINENLEMPQENSIKHMLLHKNSMMNGRNGQRSKLKK